MKRLGLTNQALGLSAFCIVTTTVHADIPLWRFSPNGSPLVTVSATGTATASYTLTNESKKPHQLVLSSTTPTGISQSGGPCVLAAVSLTNPTPTCILTLSINGSALPANYVSNGPVMCQENPNGTPNPNQCYQPSLKDTLVITRTTTPGATTLNTSIPSPSILALSANNPILNPALTGNARHITITNTGINEATGLSITYPTWPGGTPATTASSTCSATLAAGDTCTITVTPGVNATSSCDTGVVPTPGTITVNATNVATPVTSDVAVLSYGCIYQGGFIYSVDDTSINTGSIGGKTAAVTDSYPGSALPPVGIPDWGGLGTDIGSALYDTNPQGANNGSANSAAIISALTPPTSLSDYAAGLCSSLSVNASGTALCTAPNTCYTNWYLPAICELTQFNVFLCIPGSTNIQQQLFENALIPGATLGIADPGDYWSSTEDSSDPQNIALGYYFSTSGGVLTIFTKDSRLGVRCSRALTL